MYVDLSPALFTPSLAKDDTLHGRTVLLDAIPKVLDKHVKFSRESTDDEEDRIMCRRMHVRCSLLGCCT